MDIEITNLTKSYGGVKAVDDISFSVNTGEVLGFLGPNGAGKTTTMKMLTGYLGIESGRVEIDGRSIADGWARSHIGYLPEHNPLYEDMPVMEYLSFCAALQGMSSNEVDGRIRHMIRLCGLHVEKHKKIGELSKGYRQRVGLAQAMIHDPEILVFDEPTTGLDPNQIVEIRELIKTLGREKTVILSTHILPEVEATCDRILIINRGKIVADGSAGSLRQQARGKQVLHLCIKAPDNDATADALRDLAEVSGVTITDRGQSRFELLSHEGRQANEAVFRLCSSRGWVITEMIPHETKLEDIFRDLTMN